MNVVILGASNKPDRFANRAQRMLLAHGHSVIPVNPALSEVDGLTAVSLADIAHGPDTITVYLGRERMLPLVEQVSSLSPKRVILNPGADDPDVVHALRERGVPVQTACTLVLLDAGRFEHIE